jgi:hypothetical protein
MEDGSGNAGDDTLHNADGDMTGGGLFDGLWQQRPHLYKFNELLKSAIPLLQQIEQQVHEIYENHMLGHGAVKPIYNNIRNSNAAYITYLETSVKGFLKNYADKSNACNGTKFSDCYGTKIDDYNTSFEESRSGIHENIKTLNQLDAEYLSKNGITERNTRLVATLEYIANLTAHFIDAIAQIKILDTNAPADPAYVDANTKLNDIMSKATTEVDKNIAANKNNAPPSAKKDPAAKDGYNWFGRKPTPTVTPTDQMCDEAIAKLANLDPTVCNTIESVVVEIYNTPIKPVTGQPTYEFKPTGTRTLVKRQDGANISAYYEIENDGKLKAAPSFLAPGPGPALGPGPAQGQAPLTPEKAAEVDAEAETFFSVFTDEAYKTDILDKFKEMYKYARSAFNPLPPVKSGGSSGHHRPKMTGGNPFLLFGLGVLVFNRVQAYRNTGQAFQEEVDATKRQATNNDTDNIIKKLNAADPTSAGIHMTKENANAIYLKFSDEHKFNKLTPYRCDLSKDSDELFVRLSAFIKQIVILYIVQDVTRESISTKVNNDELNKACDAKINEVLYECKVKLGDYAKYAAFLDKIRRMFVGIDKPSLDTVYMPKDPNPSSPSLADILAKAENIKHYVKNAIRSEFIEICNFIHDARCDEAVLNDPNARDAKLAFAKAAAEAADASEAAKIAEAAEVAAAATTNAAANTAANTAKVAADTKAAAAAAAAAAAKKAAADAAKLVIDKIPADAQFVAEIIKNGKGAGFGEYLVPFINRWCSYTTEYVILGKEGVSVQDNEAETKPNAGAAPEVKPAAAVTPLHTSCMNPHLLLAAQIANDIIAFAIPSANSTQPFAHISIPSWREAFLLGLAFVELSADVADPIIKPHTYTSYVYLKNGADTFRNQLSALVRKIDGKNKEKYKFCNMVLLGNTANEPDTTSPTESVDSDNLEEHAKNLYAGILAIIYKSSEYAERFPKLIDELSAVPVNTARLTGPAIGGSKPDFSKAVGELKTAFNGEPTRDNVFTAKYTNILPHIQNLQTKAFEFSKAISSVLIGIPDDDKLNDELTWATNGVSALVSFIGLMLPRLAIVNAVSVPADPKMIETLTVHAYAMVADLSAFSVYCRRSFGSVFSKFGINFSRNGFVVGFRNAFPTMPVPRHWTENGLVIPNKKTTYIPFITKEVAAEVVYQYDDAAKYVIDLIKEFSGTDPDIYKYGATRLGYIIAQLIPSHIIRGEIESDKGDGEEGDAVKSDPDNKDALKNYIRKLLGLQLSAVPGSATVPVTEPENKVDVEEFIAAYTKDSIPSKIRAALDFLTKADMKADKKTDTVVQRMYREYEWRKQSKSATGLVDMFAIPPAGNQQDMFGADLRDMTNGYLTNLAYSKHADPKEAEKIVSPVNTSLRLMMMKCVLSTIYEVTGPNGVKTTMDVINLASKIAHLEKEEIIDMIPDTLSNIAGLDIKEMYAAKNADDVIKYADSVKELIFSWADKGSDMFNNVYGTSVSMSYDPPIHTGIRPGELSGIITEWYKNMYSELNSTHDPSKLTHDPSKLTGVKQYFKDICNTQIKQKASADNKADDAAEDKAEDSVFSEFEFTHAITEIGKQVNVYIHSERSEERVKDAEEAFAEAGKAWANQEGGAAHTRRRSHRRRRRHRRRSAKPLRTDIR